MAKKMSKEVQAALDIVEDLETRMGNMLFKGQGYATFSVLNNTEVRTGLANIRVALADYQDYLNTTPPNCGEVYYVNGSVAPNLSCARERWHEGKHLYESSV